MRDAFNSNLQQHKICETATKLFLEHGFDNVHLLEIAEAVEVNEKDVYRYFGSKQDIVLFLYQRINADWEAFVSELADKKLSRSFEKTLLKKIELMTPYTELLGDMMNLLVKNSAIGVSSPRTKHIRIKGIRIMQKILDESDSRLLKKRVKNLPNLLYLLHWGILFLHIQNNDLDKTKEFIKVACNILKRGGNLLILLPLIPLIKDFAKLSELLLEENLDKPQRESAQILKVVFNHRKVSNFDKNCRKETCEICIEKHLSTIDYFVSTNQPIHFILPAFPAKSPNKTKVLGELPDLGEEIALITLESMCDEIAEHQLLNI